MSISNNTNKLQNVLVQVENLSSEGNFNTFDATATVNDILEGKTAYVNDTKITGTIPIISAANPICSLAASGLLTTTITNNKGYLPEDSTSYGSYTFLPNEEHNYIASNIKSGVTIFGLAGEYEGINSSDATATANDILTGKTAYVNNEKIIGTLPVYSGEVEESESCTYTHTLSVSGYSFSYNSSTGYYTRGNAGTANSYSLMKITFNFSHEKTVRFTILNNAENNHDFGIISKLDTQLARSYTADADSLYQWCGKGLSSSSTQTLDCVIPVGEHYIEFKYRKDQSVDTSPDMFQFKFEILDLNNNSNTIYLTAGKYCEDNIVGVKGIDTSDATATATEIRSGYTAYVNNQKITGTAGTFYASMTPSSYSSIDSSDANFSYSKSSSTKKFSTSTQRSMSLSPSVLTSTYNAIHSSAAVAAAIAYEEGVNNI